MQRIIQRASDPRPADSRRRHGDGCGIRLFLFTQQMQFVLGYSALGAGVRALPLALTMGVCALLSAKLADRLGTKVVVAAGPALMAVGFGLMTTSTVHTSYSFLLEATSSWLALPARRSSLVPIGQCWSLSPSPCSDRWWLSGSCQPGAAGDVLDVEPIEMQGFDVPAELAPQLVAADATLSA